MITIKTRCEKELAYSFPYPKKDLLFFDIETTGFSPQTSALYLIGALYYEENSWHVIQWFANDYSSEKEILTAFFAFQQNFSYLIHFNGNGFDIPFLEKKCLQHELTDTSYKFIQGFDIYKAIFPYKKRFLTENLKQKTLEEFLQISRDDCYSGKELIKIYRKYLKEKTCSKEREELEQLLLLHNHDDLVGMLQFSSILYLKDLLDGSILPYNLQLEITENSLLFTGKLPFSISCLLTSKNNNHNLTIKNNFFSLEIFLYEGDLYFFYPNYKDYFYLPKEDIAIHKSVATYVDKNFREKAKKENCYTKKTGIFLPVFQLDFGPHFRKSYSDPQHFILFEHTFLKQKDLQTSYLQDFFCNNPELLLSSAPYPA